MVPAANPAGGPLVSRAKILQLLNEQKDSNARLNEELGKLVKDDTTVTKELADDRGLRQQIMNELIEQDRLDQELDKLKPRLVNAVAEGDLVLQRQQELRAREEELKKTKTARGRP
jgi:hypothetical protein